MLIQPYFVPLQRYSQPAISWQKRKPRMLALMRLLQVSYMKTLEKLSLYTLSGAQGGLSAGLNPCQAPRPGSTTPRMKKRVRIKRHLLAAQALLLCACASAQDAAPVDRARQEAVLQQIAAAAAGMSSLACDFEQAKATSMLSDMLVSTGKMYYRRESCLRWEYDPPVEYTFLLNNSQALMLAGGKRINDPKVSRFFREITGIMMNGISGSGLNDTKNFDVACYEGAGLWDIVLVPRRKDLKKMFASIKLSFNSKSYTADQIVLYESNGDVTAIRLMNKLLNTKIDDEKFKVE